MDPSKLRVAAMRIVGEDVPAKAGDRTVSLLLKDGQRVVGQVSAEDGSSMTVEFEKGGVSWMAKVPKKAIKEQMYLTYDAMRKAADPAGPPVAADGGGRMQLTFEMPGDQAWDEPLWERLGVGQEWENLGKAFYNAGVEVDDTEDIVLEFEASEEQRVRQIIADARSGKYGPDVQAYWTAAVEQVPNEGDAVDWTFDLVQDEDAGGAAPTFQVKGTWKTGEPFECRLGVELDDRGFDFEHVSGLDLSDDPDAQAELLEALYGSPAYKDVLKAYEEGGEK